MLSEKNVCRKRGPARSRILFIIPAMVFAVLAFANPEMHFNKMEIDKDSKSKWDTYKLEVIDKLKEATKQLADMETRQMKNRPIDNLQLNFLKEQVSSLNATLCNLYRLEKSTQRYAIRDISKLTKGCGHTDYDTGSDRIVFTIGNAANFVHETTHGGQFEMREIAYNGMTNGAGALCDDLYDEVAAYKAQFAFDSSSVSALASSFTAKSPDDITIFWVQGLHDTVSGHIFYSYKDSSFGLIPINVDSPLDSLIKAYPWNAGWFKNEDDNIKKRYKDSSYTFKCYPHIKYKPYPLQCQ